MSSAQSTTSSIGGEGLSWDRKEQNSWFIKSLKLPQGIETIYSGYFSKSKNLEHIILPESIKGISNQTFYECMLLKEIELPDNLEEIGQEAFSYCMSLKDIKLPENNLEEIGERAFYSCSSLTTITIPKSIKKIGEGAFDKSGLTEIHMKSIISPRHIQW